MKKLIFTVAVTLLAAGVPFPAQAITTITKLVVKANGANETPNAGAKTGSASGTFTVNTTNNTLCFTNMKTRGLANVSGAHIHLGAWGIHGSVFVTFNISNFNKVQKSCVKVGHRVLVDIAKKPGDYYFNVHTKDFPSGAVRGQLRKSA